MERRNDDDQILDDFSRRRISFLAPIIKTLETEEVEERKWKVKWLESGLINMQNARLVRGARVESLVPLSPSLPPHLYPTGSHAEFNHLTLSEPCHHPRHHLCPSLMFPFYALVARRKRLRRLSRSL